MSNANHKSNDRNGSSRGSKYAKKRKTKGTAPKAKPVDRGEPVFLYYVEGTTLQATKTPCEKTPEGDSHLGTWHHPQTGKRCKVTRVRNKTEEDAEAIAA